MAGLIDIKTDPTPREVRVFGLLWLVFFAAVGAVAAWRPDGLVGGAVFLGSAWLASLIFNSENRPRQLVGGMLPGLFGATGGAVAAGVPLARVLAALGVVAVGGALAIWSSTALGRRIYVGWMTAALPIGWSISHLVLAGVYYVVLSPIGLIMRALGRDPMHRRFDRKASTYWVRRPTDVPAARYFRQF